VQQPGWGHGLKAWWGIDSDWPSWAQVWDRDQGVQTSQPPFWRAPNLRRDNAGFLLTERFGNLDKEWWEIIAVCSQSWQTWWICCEMTDYMALGKKKIKEIRKRNSSG